GPRRTGVRVAAGGSETTGRHGPQGDDDGDEVEGAACGGRRRGRELAGRRGSGMTRRLPKCPVLGLVGGIGSGKSEVAAALARRGGCLVAGDPLGHAALRQAAVREQVVARWGQQVLDSDGEIDRTKLGAVVFADADERAALEAMVHPWISRRLREQLLAAKA